MDLLAALSAAQRVLIEVLWLSMAIGFRRELWCVCIRCPSWRAHLSTFIFFIFVTGGAVGSSVNIFTDLGLPIVERLRLAVVNVALALFLIATLAGLYRRALRVGPEKARAAAMSGLALLVPFAGLVTLLAMRGTHV